MSGTLQCDQSIAREGETCVRAPQHSCDEAGQAALVCAEATHAWLREASCLGPAGCRVHTGRVTCDDSRATEGSLCLTAGQLACSLDGAALLHCVDGRYASKARCACTIEDAGVVCR